MVGNFLPKSMKPDLNTIDAGQKLREQFNMPTATLWRYCQEIKAKSQEEEIKLNYYTSYSVNRIFTVQQKKRFFR